VERLVCSGGLRYPGFRLVREGDTIALGDYTSDLSWRPEPFTRAIDVAAVGAAFDDGATIVLQALHHTWPPLAELCRGLELDLGYPAQANAYYTPQRSQGFAVHHDTHEVFVLQTAGEKQWRVYAPLLELPLKRQKFSEKLGDPGPPVLELTLRAGDTLYLPRGWPHEALSSDSDSLHVTVGVNQYTWIDAFRAALDELGDDVDFRRSVPRDGVPPPDLLERLAARLAPEDVAARMRRRLVSTRRAVLDGQLSEVKGLRELTLDTLLERRPTVIADFDGSTLSYEGRRLTFPGHARTELAAIVAADEPFRTGELPGELDEDGRLVLVRRLILEGFVRRSAAER
jgi:hypothetical protein